MEKVFLEKIYGLDLFAGIGGLTLAIQDWVEPIAYCENDKYAQSVLLSRMSERKLPMAPIWDNIRTLKPSVLPIKPEIVYGGFPCQNISTAGIGNGLEGEHSSLFFEILRLAKEIRPCFIFLENVPAIRTRGLSVVGTELAKIGYDCRWDTLSAFDVGAPHNRERWFCLAYANRRNSESSFKNSEQRHSEEILRERNSWLAEPNVDRVADGIPFKVDRYRAMGNSVVPEQAKEAFMRLMGMEK